MTAFTPEPESEDQMQAQLEAFFESHGWTAIREVSPHHSSDRADLIVESPQYGWFGIETKFWEQDGGAKLADAHEQIVGQYRGQKYIGERIDRWVLFPYFNEYHGENARDEWRSERADWRQQFIREMLCRHGVAIGYFSCGAAVLDYAYSRAECKVPVGDHPRHNDNVDMDVIDEMIERKMNRLSY